MEGIKSVQKTFVGKYIGDFFTDRCNILLPGSQIRHSSRGSTKGGGQETIYQSPTYSASRYPTTPPTQAPPTGTQASPSSGLQGCCGA